MASDPKKEAALLYARHSRSLKHYVLQLIPGYDTSSAEDIVQDTFERTVNHLNNGKNVTSKGFLFTVARNLIRETFYRSHAHTRTDVTSEMDDFATDAHTCSPERLAVVEQKLDALKHAIAGLPRNYREAFIRRRVWNDSCREIAADMGVTEHTVAIYVGRGGRLLKEYCAEHGITLDDLSADDWKHRMNGSGPNGK